MYEWYKLSMGLFNMIQTWAMSRYDFIMLFCYLYVNVCCIDYDVISIGYELCLFKQNNKMCIC